MAVKLSTVSVSTNPAVPSPPTNPASPLETPTTYFPRTSSFAPSFSGWLKNYSRTLCPIHPESEGGLKRTPPAYEEFAKVGTDTGNLDDDP